MKTGSAKVSRESLEVSRSQKKAKEVSRGQKQLAEVSRESLENQ